jgi:ABC-type Fe3+/spermidine/putrescine transport system ATPase subunit
VAARSTAARDPRHADLGTGWLAVLRPESLLLSTDDDALAWRGVVRARHFAGGATHCHVALDGTSVELATTDRRVRDRIREGDRVGVRLAGTPVALVADDGTSPIA